MLMSAFTAGTDDYISKPIALKEFSARLVCSKTSMANQSRQHGAGYFRYLDGT
jgi:DNA-binding response OmpR family regulator